MLRRLFTRDDAAAAFDTRLRFYTTEKLGPTQALTPEGFLLCSDVPIARTGRMEYAPGEVPLEPGQDGIVVVTRDEAEVFRPEFIASFNGKPVVNDHPPTDVRPENWRLYAVGTIVNPRRGAASQSDLLIADLLIYEPRTIEDVRAGKREVSCGYDADYEETGPGQGKQTNMIGNHVALVDSGRCGPRCAIGDRKHPLTGDDPMKTRDSAAAPRKLAFIDRLRKAFKAKDENEFEEALEEAEDAAVGDPDEHIHIHAGGDGYGDRRMSDDEIGAGFEEMRQAHGAMQKDLETIKKHLGLANEGNLGGGAQDTDEEEEKKRKEKEAADAEATKEIEGQVAAEAPPGTTDSAIKGVKDSALLADSFQNTIAMAEILAPGISMPTFDSKAKPKATLDAMCGLRRSALDLAYKMADTKAMIDSLLGGRPLEVAKMSCNDVRTMFLAAAGMKKAANGVGATRDTTAAGTGTGVAGPIKDIAALNKMYAERYGKAQAH